MGVKNRNSLILLWLLLSAFAGGAVATWVAPRTIAWYFEPPVEIGVNCRPATEWAMAGLMKAQMWGMIAGFVLAAVVLFLKTRRDPPAPQA